MRRAGVVLMVVFIWDKLLVVDVGYCSGEDLVLLIALRNKN
jgi:hypothetical protein